MIFKFTRIVFIYLCLFFVLCLTAFTHWEIADKSTLHSEYYPYELCVLNIAKQGNYDANYNIHQQPLCTHLIDKFFQSIPKRCWLGSRQQINDDGICVQPKKYMKCRPLKFREGFWMHWSNLKSSPRNSIGYIGELIDAVLDRNYDTIAFAGDSMAVQMAHRFGCQLLRKNISFVEHGPYFSMQHSVAAIITYDTNNNIRSHFSSLPLRVNRLPVHKPLYVLIYKANCGMGTFPRTKSDSCQTKSCLRKMTEKYIYTQTIQAFQRYFQPKWGNMLHLFTIPIIAKEPWQYSPLGKALLHISDMFQKINSSLIVMAPLMQHFVGDPYGQFINKSYLNYGRFGSGSHHNDKRMKVHNNVANNLSPHSDWFDTCHPHASTMPLSSHPEASLFIQTMNTLNSSWINMMGWLDLSSYSIPWYDLHPESGATGWPVDCTHYAFSPFMYEIIWSELASYIRYYRNGYGQQPYNHDNDD